MPDRAVVFIDGNNWYHALKDVGVERLGQLDYRRISEKLLGPRTWVATRYYVGRVPQAKAPRDYAAQRHFLTTLTATDSRISVRLGRLEARRVEDPAARALARYLANLPTRVDPAVYRDLHELALRFRKAEVLVEKAVDVMLAVDMVVMAERDALDAAYLLSADGDFTPAAEAVRGLGKRVYAASPLPGAQLAAAVDSFIRLRPGWFADCYQ